MSDGGSKRKAARCGSGAACAGALVVVVLAALTTEYSSRPAGAAEPGANVGAAAAGQPVPGERAARAGDAAGKKGEGKGRSAAGPFRSITLRFRDKPGPEGDNVEVSAAVAPATRLARISSAGTTRPSDSAPAAAGAAGGGGDNVIRNGTAIDVARFNAGLEKYVAALTKSAGKTTVQYVGRERIESAVPPAPADVQALRAEPSAEVTLPQFVSPPLDPADRDKIVRHSLMITDLSVVDNARALGNGSWSFGRLMRELANTQATGIKAEAFVQHWADQFGQPATINGLPVAGRTRAADFLKAWEKNADGTLNLDKAPFRLLAIVNRIDLRDNLVLGVERIGGGGAGEARFVYCATDAAGNGLPFTVIFEYQIKRNDFAGVLDWAGQWYQLQQFQLGTEDYRKRLEDITEQFVRAGSDPESPPNRSALAQLRTNEIHLDQPWELREFRIDAHNDGMLRQVTVKQTPDVKGAAPDAITDFIEQLNLSNVIDERLSMPVRFPVGSPFMAGSALTPPNFFLDGPATESRHFVSLATCNGCHAREAFPQTGNFNNDPGTSDAPTNFTHIKPRNVKVAAGLSLFVKGDTGGPLKLADPKNQPDNNEPGGVRTREFFDLDRRAINLRDLVEFGVTADAGFAPLQLVH